MDATRQRQREQVERLADRIGKADTDEQLLGYARQMRQVFCGGVGRHGELEIKRPRQRESYTGAGTEAKDNAKGIGR